MLRVSRILRAAEEDYRMDHTAPDRGSGAPLYDVTLNGIYPEDFYGPEGLRYYGDGSPMDARSYGIIQSFHDKPYRKITIYRAVPKNLNSHDLLKTYEADKRYILKHGKLPSIVSSKCPPSALTKYGTSEKQRASGYYDWLYDQVEALKNRPSEEGSKIVINPGDWVSINSDYVRQHGEYFTDGKRILSKTVPASFIYTCGDSFHEWGYDPA